MLWHQLTDLSQIELLKKTYEEQSGLVRTVLIFKHSSRCGVSAMVLHRLESRWKDTDSMPCYFLDLLSHHDISEAIALEFGVKHESPQVLLIKNGKCVYHQSHNGIRAEEIVEVVKTLPG
jgi:bacillithiol system protein YtxJ